MIREMDDMALKAMRVLGKYLDSPAKAKDVDAARQARVASSVLSSYATLCQAENNAEAMRLMAAKELAGANGEKFKRYLGANNTNGVKRLGSGR